MPGKPDEPLASNDVVRVALKGLKSNSMLNLAGRVLLIVFALATVSAAAVLVFLRADEMIKALTDGSGATSIWTELLALTAPVLLLVLLAGLAVLMGFIAHSRGLDESLRTFDTINRVRREGEVAVSARGLVVAFEAQLVAIKRSHSVILWVARTLFIVSLGLFVVCVIDAIADGIDTTTVVLGAGSLAGALFGTVRKLPKTIAHEAANVVQVQLIVTGAHRQVSLLESAAFALINDENQRPSALDKILQIQERIEGVVDTAIKQAEQFADPEPEAARILKFQSRPARAA